MVHAVHKKLPPPKPLLIPEKDWVAIVDFGSQYSQLIARRLRELNVYSAILLPNFSLEEIKAHPPKGIILSGGPASVYAPGAPRCDPAVFRLGIPILGICYGMQLGCRVLGGEVRPARGREFGGIDFTVRRSDSLLHDVPRSSRVWMSHGDRVDVLASGFTILGSTRSCTHAAVKHNLYPFYGVQFHPEVVHTPYGMRIIKNFVTRISRCKRSWKISSYLQEMIEDIRSRVGNRRVMCALSGGVDSSVTASIVHRAIGKNLICVFVDNGVLRKNEARKIGKFFKGKMHFNLKCVDATDQFLKRLKEVADPERKRKIIGAEFIRVFKDAVRHLDRVSFLAQGTLYPDVIESQSAFGGPSVTIKTHHNVGGLPAQLGFQLIEPLRFLFKDEVRQLGRELGLPEALIQRQPFPGPGLAVRVIGEITRKRLDVLREADDIVTTEIEKSGHHKKLWQYFAVLLPINTVGVMGDERTYENVVAVRAVYSVDGMTADWGRLPEDLLSRISSRIINEVKGVNRVVYDISSKPPSTIEWE